MQHLSIYVKNKISFHVKKSLFVFDTKWEMEQKNQPTGDRDDLELYGVTQKKMLSRIDWAPGSYLSGVLYRLLVSVVVNKAPGTGKLI